MNHIYKFEDYVNENFFKRQFNKAGKAFKFGDRLTTKNNYSEEPYPSLSLLSLKEVINYISGKSRFQIRSSSIKDYLTKINTDLKTILDKNINNNLVDKNKISIIKTSYDKILNIINRVPEYDPKDKNQYAHILDILNKLYKLSYNEGN